MTDPTGGTLRHNAAAAYAALPFARPASGRNSLALSSHFYISHLHPSSLRSCSERPHVFPFQGRPQCVHQSLCSRLDMVPLPRTVVLT